MNGHVTYARCWSCMLGFCYPTVTPHTWMDDDDIDHARTTGQPVPDDLVTGAPCSCTCSGQAGHHRELTDDEAAAIVRAVEAIDDGESS